MTSITFDEARDLAMSDEIFEEDEVFPADGGDPERPLTPEELHDLWIHDPGRFEDDSDREAFESYLDSIDKNRS